ncbi:Mitochondrial mRNA pseudouridine synthase Trub2 [Halotydeus destructor]|nr:Mitochondrial mRNA pseudouridine synthase Trub2 [Halotydeus destructor]
MSTEIYFASKAWRHLNGLFCLYKEAKIGRDSVKKLLASKLTEGLNQLEVREQKEIVSIEGSLADNNLKVVKRKSYADHPLVIGPRYQDKDVKIFWAHYPGWHASGLMVGGVGPDGQNKAAKLRTANFVRTYEIDCLFGRATKEFMSEGRTVEKSTFKHVSKERFDHILTKYQASHRTRMFEAAGVSMDSQAAYDLVVNGSFRPLSNKTLPIVYSLKCTKFEKPNFTLRFQLINENPEFFGETVVNLALQMKTAACVERIRCTRFGKFTLEHSLLPKHWTLENMMNNILESDELCPEDELQPDSMSLKTIDDKKAISES